MKKLFLTMAMGLLICGILWAANQVARNPYELDTFPAVLTGKKVIGLIVWENAQTNDTIVLKYKPSEFGTWTELINTTAKANGTAVVPLLYPLTAYDFTVSTLTHGNLRIYLK